MPTRHSARLLVITLCGAALLGVILSRRVVPFAHAAAAPPDPASTSGTAVEPPVINLRRTVTVQVVEQTKNAVVNISATKMVSQRVSNFGVDPFWQPFDMGRIVQVPADSLGSGFIIHPDGYVVTNNHVIDRAREIHVELADGRKLKADLISADPDADLALLRIHSPKPLPTLDLGESDDLMIGEPVIAVGNPLGFSHTVSTGIVSALHRDIDPTRAQPNTPAAQNQPPLSGEEAALHDLIQTDAAINPGNSGGPLLNAYGQVIGIDTAIRSDAQNIGFAIPIDRLRNLIPELMNPAQVTKVEVPLQLVEHRTMIEPATVAAQVLSNDPSHHVLQSINGTHPQNIIDAYALLLRLHAGTPATVQWADAAPQTLHPTAAPRPDAGEQAQRLLGLTLRPVTPTLVDQLHLSAEDGLLVTTIDRDSPAARAGVEPGDVLVQLGRYPVTAPDQLAALISHLPAHGRLHIAVLRGDDLLSGPLAF